MACNDKCFIYKASRKVNESFYNCGAKRCTTCSIFIKWDGNYCPCCGYKLRFRARNGKERRNFVSL